jgi:hypothetical protein
MKNSGPKELATALQAWRSLQECLLDDLRFANYGYSVELTFNYIWDRAGRLRPGAQEQPLHVRIRLDGVQELHMAGGLTESILARPELIDWGLSEVALVRAIHSKRAPLALEVRWEGGERRIEIHFHEFEFSAPDALLPRGRT